MLYNNKEKMNKYIEDFKRKIAKTLNIDPAKVNVYGIKKGCLNTFFDLNGEEIE